MPQLLIEFFSEEIPARMQKRAEEDLARAFNEKLKAHGLEPKAIKTFSSPRRIGLVIDDMPGKAADVNEEKKGPRVGAPDQAVQGFLKSAGLSSIDQAEIVEDKKGAFYVARIERAGRATAAIVQEIAPEIVRAFPWPKSMRSGSSDLQWVRPLHNVLCLFDGAPVKIEIEGVGSKPETHGHRFHAPEAIKPKDFADYSAKLRASKVLIDREERKSIILEAAKKLCAEKKLELVEDAGLLEEVAGLVEWPVTLLGDMDPAFLDLPGEVIRLSMRTHQKYSAVRDPKTQKLAPHFITVANVEAKDGGKAIAAGNARVLSARLNDARFFWDVDRKTKLFTEERRDKLKKIVFHQKLGSVWDKVERVKALAVELCAVTGADAALVARAAELAKMDLVTETVGEFPELQGQIGRQLAAFDGEPESVAIAVEDHYRPLGPNDRVPKDTVAVTLALADKLDTLAAFWKIDEKPTGSSDPYALRRAALGAVRIVVANEKTVNLHYVLDRHLETQFGLPVASASGLALEVVYFIHDRLRVQLRDAGKRHDLLDAVLENASSATEWPLTLIVARVEALDAFLKTEDGANLLAGYKRAANILIAEEKKGKGLSESDLAAGLDASKLTEPAEKSLHAALESALPTARSAVEKEDFAGAMKALSALRAPVDAFFEKVLVNAEEPLLRRNRLLLLSRLREALSQVADFSKIEG
ncbi:MAG TPA: glycine--tRNA ligase subunit beta [Rhodospirillaceae bacterium]|nr:glycine--tRNA ligase subunit beta [Rhodospirillaceae bacterium]